MPTQATRIFSFAPKTLPFVIVPATTAAAAVVPRKFLRLILIVLSPV
jgi:hypothetical protein